MSNKTVFTVSEIKEGRVGINSTQSVRRELKERKATTQKSKNKIVVDLSELLRVYQPDELDFDLLTGKVRKQEANSNVAVISALSENTVSANVRVLEERINSKDKEIELLEKQLDREREINDDIKEALQKSQSHETKLLEFKKTEAGQGEEWQAAITELKDKVANQEKASHEKFEVMVKEKSDVEKANRVYKFTGIIFVCAAIAVTIYVLIEQGVIQLN